MHLCLLILSNAQYKGKQDYNFKWANYIKFLSFFFPQYKPSKTYMLKLKNMKNFFFFFHCEDTHKHVKPNSAYKTLQTEQTQAA